MIQKGIVRVTLNLIRSIFPKSFANEVRRIHPKFLQDMWTTQSLNGQAIRTSFISRVFDEINFDYIIETGTFLGNTTIFLSSLSNAKTFTIDVNEKYSKFAQQRFLNLKSDRDVSFRVGKSEVILKEILDDIASDKLIFFYLDAHWGSNLPLREELLSVLDWGGNFIAIIDDFYVSSDLGYGFDSYGDKAVGPQEVPNFMNSELFSLNSDSRYETGAKRGSGVLISRDLLSSLSTKTTEKIKPVVV